MRADAARLPFRNGTFQALVCNHSLEHFSDLEGALRDIGRVVRPDGALFASVPDARTFQDRLCRWLVRKGGHVNLFTNPGELAAALARHSGLPQAGTIPLHGSLFF